MARRRDDPTGWRTARDKDGNAYLELPNRGSASARALAAQMGVGIDDNGIIVVSEKALLELAFSTMHAILTGKASRYDARRWQLIRQWCTEAELEQIADALGAQVPS